MSNLEALLDEKVNLELNTYCPNKLDCSKCKALCPEVKRYNEILEEINKEENKPMSRRYVIADLHFGHKNVIEYCNRPFATVEEMDAAMICKWNSVVKDEDTVYVLGDFILTRNMDKIKDLVSRLRGHKVLVMGNHDTRKPKDYIEAGFIQATRKPILLEPRLVLMHEPPAEDDIWFRCDYIFGHVHDKKCAADDYGNCACVSADRIDFTPVDLDKLLKTMDSGRGPKYGD